MGEQEERVCSKGLAGAVGEEGLNDKFKGWEREERIRVVDSPL